MKACPLVGVQLAQVPIGLRMTAAQRLAQNTHQWEAQRLILAALLPSDTTYYLPADCVARVLGGVHAK